MSVRFLAQLANPNTRVGLDLVLGFAQATPDLGDRFLQVFDALSNLAVRCFGLVRQRGSASFAATCSFVILLGFLGEHHISLPRRRADHIGHAGAAGEGEAHATS